MGNKNKHEVTAQRIPLPEAFEALIDRTSKHGNPNTAANYRSALNKLKVYLTEKTRDGNTCKSEGEKLVSQAGRCLVPGFLHIKGNIPWVYQSSPGREYSVGGVDEDTTYRCEIQRYGLPD